MPDIANKHNEQLVSDAFSKQSVVFDDTYQNNTTTLWMRDRVRKEVLQYIKPGNTILELNCGTGIDSLFLAQKGYHVLATDNAPGMLGILENKISTLSLQDKIETKQCSFNELEKLGNVQFDYIFSNFGGLNCTDQLEKILHDTHKLLNPGGHFTFVIMPAICPWELLLFFKGYFKTAFRRFKKTGTPAHLEGVHFTCYYYNPSFVIKAAGPGFKLKALKGLAILVPPPFIEHFKEKHPKLFSRLEKLENKIWDKSPFKNWCDHYVITMQKQ